jgi:hypothetical protein
MTDLAHPTEFRIELAARGGVFHRHNDADSKLIHAD